MVESLRVFGGAGSWRSKARPSVARRLKRQLSRLLMAGAMIATSLTVVATLELLTQKSAAAAVIIPAPNSTTWDINGSASLSGGNLQLTPAAEGQTGSAWYATPISLGSSGTLTVSFDVNMSGGTDADGVSVDLLNAGSYAATAVGDGGGGLGFAGLGGVGVAFDSFNDGGCGYPSANFAGVVDGSTCGSSDGTVTKLSPGN
jgi:Bacterial lectin